MAFTENHWSVFILYMLRFYRLL